MSAPSEVSARLSVPKSVLLTELADGTGVLLDLQTKFYYTLNATGLFLWKSVVAGTSAPAALAVQVAEAFEVEPAVAEADTRELLGELVAEGLLSQA
jgi:hypothetical protein